VHEVGHIGQPEAARAPRTRPHLCGPCRCRTHAFPL
jgi:hypothetical protein